MATATSPARKRGYAVDGLPGVRMDSGGSVVVPLEYVQRQDGRIEEHCRFGKGVWKLVHESGGEASYRPEISEEINPVSGLSPENPCSADFTGLEEKRSYWQDSF